jgi:hypothetical protein
VPQGTYYPSSTLVSSGRSLVARALRFEGHAGLPIRLNEHKGSALRGALFHALRGRPGTGGGFCVRRELPSCHPCDLHPTCPISAFVAPVQEDSQRGIDPPRPFTVEPPLDGQTYYPAGAPFHFGLTLFGDAIQLLPYVIHAVRDLERTGIGQIQRTDHGQIFRGTFVLDRIVEYNPVTGEERALWDQTVPRVRSPELLVRDEQVERSTQRLVGLDHLSLELLTPLRLIQSGRLVRRLAFRVLLHRLIERYCALAGQEVDTRPFWPVLEGADAVSVAEDRTHWVELESYSTRRQAHTPLSGLVGQITFSGEMALFLPWVIWGQITHVGKETTKGNGWYRLR